MASALSSPESALLNPCLLNPPSNQCSTITLACTGYQRGTLPHSTSQASTASTGRAQCRHASNGSLITQTAELEGIAGIVPHTPGFDGQFFYLGRQKETLVRVTYDSGTCKSEPAA